MKLRFIAWHMMYDRIAPDEPTERAGDDQQVVRQHEARSPPPPIPIAVQHRYHHRHGRRPPIAITMWMPEEQRDHAHHRSGTIPAWIVVRCRTGSRTRSRPAGPAGSASGRAGQQQRLAADPPDSLPNAITEPRQRDRADQHADVDLDVMDRVSAGLIPAMRVGSM
jgi:hypothetical protein